MCVSGCVHIQSITHREQLPEGRWCQIQPPHAQRVRFQNNYEDTWTTNWTRSACEVTPFLHSTVPDSIDHHYRNRSGYKTFSVREHTPSPAHRLPPPTLSSAACPPASIRRPDTTHSHNPPSHAARPQSAGAHSSRAHCSLDTSPGLPCRTDLRRFPTTLARQVVNQDVVVVLSQHHILRGDLPETIPHPYVLLHAPLHAHARPQRDHHPTAALRLPVKEVKSPVPSQPAGLGISYATRGAPTTTAGERGSKGEYFDPSSAAVRDARACLQTPVPRPPLRKQRRPSLVEQIISIASPGQRRRADSVKKG